MFINSSSLCCNFCIQIPFSNEFIVVGEYSGNAAQPDTDMEKMDRLRSFAQRSRVSVMQWVDTDYGNDDPAAIKAKPDQVEWVRTLPFLILHLGCLGVIWVGWSWTAVVVAAGLYLARMFAITGF